MDDLDSIASLTPRPADRACESRHYDDQRADGTVRVSKMCARPEMDASAICKQVGGGGRMCRAAGAAAPAARHGQAKKPKMLRGEGRLCGRLSARCRLLMDKPQGFTSHDVVAEAAAFCTRKIGRRSIRATGVPVFIGSTTKAAGFRRSAGWYVAGFYARLLRTPDTQDVTGEIMPDGDQIAAEYAVGRAVRGCRTAADSADVLGSRSAARSFVRPHARAGGRTSGARHHRA